MNKSLKILNELEGVCLKIKKEESEVQKGKLLDQALLKLNELQKSSKEETFYWQFCSFSVYEQTYGERLGYYNLIFPDSNEQDFIKEELQNLDCIDENIGRIEKVIYGQTTIKLFFPKNNFFPFYEKNRVEPDIDEVNNDEFSIYEDVQITRLGVKDLFKKQIKITEKRKKEWLQKRLVALSEVDNVESSNNQILVNVDLLNSINKKLLVLQEIGLLDLIAEKYKCGLGQGCNTSRLGHILSVIIQEKPASITPILNFIYNKTSDPKYNPRRSEETMEDVMQVLRPLIEKYGSGIKLGNP